MSTYFSKVIKAGERQREFNFRKLPGNNELRYHIDVSDDKGNRIIFTMHKNDEGYWKADVPALPVWILSSENVLGEAIEENNQLSEKAKSGF